MLWILILSVDLVRNGCAPATLSRLRRLGLFWHFLDIVWIGIYSVVYLPGML
jgi:cytochrome o ubiquinol oxidase subunit 3